VTWSSARSTHVRSLRGIGNIGSPPWAGAVCACKSPPIGPPASTTATPATSAKQAALRSRQTAARSTTLRCPSLTRILRQTPARGRGPPSRAAGIRHCLGAVVRNDGFGALPSLLPCARGGSLQARRSECRVSAAAEGSPRPSPAIALTGFAATSRQAAVPEIGDQQGTGRRPADT
jgi:hypothetical protein